MVWIGTRSVSRRRRFAPHRRTVVGVHFLSSHACYCIFAPFAVHDLDEEVSREQHIQGKKAILENGVWACLEIVLIVYNKQGFRRVWMLNKK